MAQFSSIVAVLAGHIEINPLFQVRKQLSSYKLHLTRGMDWQEMVRCVNHPLAVCGLILDRSGAIIWLDRPAPPLPWQLMFE